MGAPVLIIDGVEYPQRSRLDFQQTFEIINGGFSGRRLASGALLSMKRWEKWATNISGGGWVPAPLLKLPRGVPVEVHSVAPITLLPTEALPTGWAARTDWPEQSLTDDLGVTVRFIYPILTVVTLSGPRLVVGGSSTQWEIAFEEP